MDYLEEQRALLRKRRLERLIVRARRRLERRKARSEAIWTRHVQKTGRQPTVWHNSYERAYALEGEAHILLTWLSVLAGQMEAPAVPETAQTPAPSAPGGPSKTLAVWREGHYLAVSWACPDRAQQRHLLDSFKRAFPEDRAFVPTSQSWCLHKRWLHVLRDWASRHFSPDEQDWEPHL